MLGGAAASGFFCAVAEPLRELVPEGGGDFKRGDVGQCGVLSSDAPALLGALGSFETPSGTGPACKLGTFAADNALCIAAAEGCVEMGVESG